MSKGLIPFAQVFPQQGTAETRVLTVSGHSTLPDDEYALVEAYCDDPACDCRRCMLNVLAHRQQRVLASISYGFDRDGEYPGPFLDPLNPQSAHAAALLALVTPVLADGAYRARLEAHYHQLKRAVAVPPSFIRQSSPPPHSATGRSRHRPKKKRK